MNEELEHIICRNADLIAFRNEHSQCKSDLGAFTVSELKPGVVLMQCWKHAKVCYNTVKTEQVIKAKKAKPQGVKHTKLKPAALAVVLAAHRARKAAWIKQQLGKRAPCGPAPKVAKKKGK